MKKLTISIVAILMAMALTVSVFAVDMVYTDAKTPSYTYTVNGDITELTATVTILDFVYDEASWKDGAIQDGAGWNDWCGQAIIVTAPDGTVHYHDWGGASVTWGVDFDGDGVTETEGNNWGSTTWLAEVGAGQTVDLVVPVYGAGTVVEFFVNSWDTYLGVQYTLEVSGDTEAPAVEETPAVEEEPAVEETPAVEDTPAVEEPKEEEPADTGLALAVVPAVLAMAVAVISKRK